MHLPTPELHTFKLKHSPIIIIINITITIVISIRLQKCPVMGAFTNSFSSFLLRKMCQTLSKFNFPL